MVIPIVSPVHYPQLFAVERARLLELVRSLNAAGWHAPSPCPGWSVLGLVSHLIGDDLSLVSWQRDHHHGTTPPDGLDEHGFIGWLDELQIEWVNAARRLSPQLAVELLEWLGDRVASTVAAQDPSEVTAMVSWASSQAVPVWLDQGRELSERWIHRQQILQAVGRPSDLRGDLTGPILEAMKWAFPYRLGVHRREAGSTVSIEIEAPLQREWYLVSDGSDWDFAPEPELEPAASIKTTAEQLWRLMTNNYEDQSRPEVRLGGDPELLSTLASTRSIIGAPK